MSNIDQSSRPKKIVKSVGRIVLTVFLSLFLFVFTFSAAFLAVLQKTIAGDAISSALDNVDIAEVLLDTGVADFVWDNIPEFIKTNYGLDKDNFIDMLERGVIPRFIARFADKYIESIKDEVFANTVIDERITAFFSYYSIIIVAVFAAVIIFDIIVLNRRNISGAFAAVSVPFLATGIIFGVLSVLIRSTLRGTINIWFVEFQSGVIGIFANIIRKLAEDFSAAALFYAFIAVGIGLFLIVAAITVGIIRSKTDKTKPPQTTEQAKSTALVIIVAAVNIVLPAVAAAWAYFMFFY